jgi:hypothetical protein
VGVVAGLLVGKQFSSAAASDKLVTPQRIGGAIGGLAGYLLAGRV